MDTVRYSIVIPAFNESARIKPTLDRILAHASQQGWQAEIIVVNDGSRDDTGQVIREYASKHPPVRLIENSGNRGKGYSVRNGMLHARGEFVLFTDADLSSPIEEADKLFECIARNADIAIGSRWLRAEMQTTRQPFMRQFLGRLFNLALKVILGLNFKDTQCGFKAFRRRAGQAIFCRQLITGWGFDPELLFLARALGCKTEEIPVAWAHDHLSKINPIVDGLKMFADLFKIRWNSITGKYNHHAELELAAVASDAESVVTGRSG